MLLVGKLFWTAFVLAIMVIIYQEEVVGEESSPFMVDVILPAVGRLSVLIMIGCGIAKLWI